MSVLCTKPQQHNKIQTPIREREGVLLKISFEMVLLIQNETGARRLVLVTPCPCGIRESMVCALSTTAAATAASAATATAATAAGRLFSLGLQLVD